MRTRPLLRRALAAGAAVALMSTLSACSLTSLATKLVEDASGKNDWVQPAEIHNRAIADETAELLAFVQEDDWEEPAGGNVLTRCEAPETYSFYGSWFSSESTEAPADAESAATAIGTLSTWLEARGWTDLEEFDFATESIGVNALGVSAWNEGLGIFDMQAIYYYEGDVGVDYPHVVVDVDSDCLPADLDSTEPSSSGSWPTIHASQ